MKKLWLMMVFFLLLTAAVTGCGRKPDAAPPAPLEVTDQTDMFAPGSFQDPSICGGCHNEIYQAWLGSPHALAWSSGIFQPDYRLAHLETDGGTDLFCGGCHAPVGMRTGLLPPHDGSRFDRTANAGVSCDFCHTISAVKETFNMGNISEPGNVKRGPRGDHSSPYHEVFYSEIHTRAQFCGACHNVRHPSSGVKIIDTYDDWLNGPYAAQGIRCQDCHMTPTPGVGINPGKSATMGKARDHVATHFFLGGSAYLLREAGFPDHAGQAEENLRAAAELELTGRLVPGGLELTVNITNVGAGHKIPTGVTYIRKIWLEITVRDSQGNIVFALGHIDENNHVDPNATFFRLLFKDAEGNLTSKSWLAEGIGYDRRLSPLVPETEKYLISANGSEFTASARLLYRSVSQSSLDFHHGPGVRLVPTVEMAAATIEIK